MLMSSLASSRVRSFVRSLRREGEKVRKYTSVSRSANSFDRCNRKRIPFLELAIVSIERRYDERPARKEKSAGLDSLWREGELSLFLSLAHWPCEPARSIRFAGWPMAAAHPYESKDESIKRQI